MYFEKTEKKRRARSKVGKMVKFKDPHNPSQCS